MATLRNRILSSPQPSHDAYQVVTSLWQCGDSCKTLGKYPRKTIFRWCPRMYHTIVIFHFTNLASSIHAMEKIHLGTTQDGRWLPETNSLKVSPVVAQGARSRSWTAAWDWCQPIHSISKSNSQRLSFNSFNSFNVPRWVRREGPVSLGASEKELEMAETWAQRRHLGILNML